MSKIKKSLIEKVTELTYCNNEYLHYICSYTALHPITIPNPFPNNPALNPNTNPNFIIIHTLYMSLSVFNYYLQTFNLLINSFICNLRIKLVATIK